MDVGSIVGMLAGAALLALAWVVVEHRAESPLIDMAMMRMPAVWSVNLIALTTGFCMFATNAFVPQLVQAPRSTGYGFGVSMTEAGLMQLPYPVGMFAVIVVSGALVRRFGAKAVIMGGSLASGSGVLLIALLHAAKWQIYLGNTLLGLGVGIVFICLSTLTVFSVPPDQTGVASGMMTNIRVIGGSIGTAVTASIVTAAVAPGQIAPETGYVHAFATLGAGFILTAVLTLAIPRTPYAGHVDAPAPAPRKWLDLSVAGSDPTHRVPRGSGFPTGARSRRCMRRESHQSDRRLRPATPFSSRTGNVQPASPTRSGPVARPPGLRARHKCEFEEAARESPAGAFSLRLVGHGVDPRVVYGDPAKGRAVQMRWSDDDPS